jgi:hypothetical protein
MARWFPFLASKSVLRLAGAISAALLIVIAAPAPAAAVSMADLIALSRAGLSDEVLVALVEADNTSFPLDAPKILELRQQGLSERVITAMLKSGRPDGRRTPAFPGSDPNAACPGCDPAGQQSAAADEPPSLVIIGAQKEEPPEPAPQQVIVMPWGYPIVGVTGGHHPPRHVFRPRTPYRGFGRFINDGFIDGKTIINPR